MQPKMSLSFFALPILPTELIINWLIQNLMKVALVRTLFAGNTKENIQELYKKIKKCIYIYIHTTLYSPLQVAANT